MVVYKVRWHGTNANACHTMAYHTGIEYLMYVHLTYGMVTVQVTLWHGNVPVLMHVTLWLHTCISPYDMVP